MKKKEKISSLADGEYLLGRPYWALPSDLILCRILSSCEAVRRELDKLDRQARKENWTPFMQGFAECMVNKNVICSLDIAGLTGRRHDSVLRFMDRRREKRPGFFVWPGPSVDYVGLFLEKRGRPFSLHGARSRVWSQGATLKKAAIFGSIKKASV